METTLKMRLYTAVVAVDAAYQLDMLHNHQTYVETMLSHPLAAPQRASDFVVL